MLTSINKLIWWGYNRIWKTNKITLYSTVRWTIQWNTKKTESEVASNKSRINLYGLTKNGTHQISAISSHYTFILKLLTELAG